MPHAYSKKSTRGGKQLTARRLNKLNADVSLNFLRKMCPNNNECVALGAFADLSNKYFENMSYKYAKDPINAVGANSVNGVIRKIMHKRSGYTTTSMLKASKSARSDNLMYEYVVGLFINKYNKRFPCFLHTYACYKYPENSNLYDNVIKNTQTAEDLLKLELLHSSDRDMSPKDFMEFIKKSCAINKNACISLQYFENPTTLEKLIFDNLDDDYFKEFEMLYILLQLFIPLGNMMTIFTHNDLHTQNVLIYTIPEFQTVKLTYNTPSGPITFRTRYICKIIDYGRCYFNDTTTGLKSPDVLKALCGTPACGDTCAKKTCIVGTNGINYCGESVGYAFADQEHKPNSNFNISILLPEHSNDMKVAKMISSYDIFDKDTIIGTLIEEYKTGHTVKTYMTRCIKAYKDTNPPPVSASPVYGEFIIDAMPASTSDYKFIMNSKNKYTLPSQVMNAAVARQVFPSKRAVKSRATNRGECPPQYEKSPATNRCVKSCNANQTRNAITRRCNKKMRTPRPKSRGCPPLYERSSATNKCIKSCRANQTRNAITRRCNKKKHTSSRTKSRKHSAASTGMS